MNCIVCNKEIKNTQERVSLIKHYKENGKMLQSKKYFHFDCFEKDTYETILSPIFNETPYSFNIRKV